MTLISMYGILPHNSAIAKNPDIIKDWCYELNDKIKLDITKVTFGSEKIAWWNCEKCKSVYELTIERKVNGKGCLYCAGKLVNNTNSLSALYPLIAVEWHPTLNGDLTPDNITTGTQRKVWWLGKECGHEWEANVNNRTRKLPAGCPYCSFPVRKILKGFNDVWATHPELASLLLDPEDGYKYTYSSNVKTDWRCKDCENIVKSRSFNKVSDRGFTCPSCSDGLSFGERFTYNLLIDNKIHFEYDKPQSWSLGKRYDFYLPEHNWIIEVHGVQHYRPSFETISPKNRTFEEEKENDIFKETIAKENRIDNYIILDVRESSISYIQKSLLQTDIMRIISKPNFKKIGELSTKTIVKEVCEKWNTMLYADISSLASSVKLHPSTVKRYLIRGTEIGWCNYNKTN